MGLGCFKKRLINKTIQRRAVQATASQPCGFRFFYPIPALTENRPTLANKTNANIIGINKY